MYPSPQWGGGVPRRPLMSHRQGPDGDRISHRLSGIAGHAASVKRLWDEDRECVEILTQIAAVRASLDQIGKSILEHHLEHCVLDAVENGDAAKAITDLKHALNRFI